MSTVYVSVSPNIGNDFKQIVADLMRDSSIRPDEPVAKTYLNTADVGKDHVIEAIVIIRPREEGDDQS